MVGAVMKELEHAKQLSDEVPISKLSCCVQKIAS